MSKCVNTNSEDFQKLVKESGINPAILSAKMGAYMTEKDTDEWPNLEELGFNYGNTPNNIESEETVNYFINRVIAKLPGIDNVKWIDAFEIHDILNFVNTDADSSKINAFVYNNTAYLVKGRVNSEIGLEEILHPFINALFDENPTLFNKLYDSIIKDASFSSLVSKIKRDYSKAKLDYKKKEIVTQVLSKLSKKELVANKEHNIRELINSFWKWISNWLKSNLNIQGSKYIFSVDKLSNHFTLSDLAKLINTKDVEIRSFSRNKGINFSTSEYNEVRSKIKHDSSTQAHTEEANVLEGIEKTLENAIKNLQFKLSQATRGGTRSSSETRYLNNLIDDINKVNAEKATVFAILDASKSINSFYNKFEEYRQKGELDAAKLLMWNNLVKGFFWLDDIDKMLKANSTTLSKEFKEHEVIKGLENILTKKDKIIEVYNTEGKKILAKYLAKYSDVGEAKEKNRVEAKYRALPEEFKDKISFDKFWEEYYDENKEAFEDITYNSILKELDTLSSDIDVMRRWLSSTMDSPDLVAGAAATSYAQMLTETNVANHVVRDQLSEVVKKLEDKYGKFFKTDISEMYDFMIEKDSKGKKTGHRVAQFTSQLLKDLKAKQDELDKHDKLDSTAKARELWKFKESIAPRRDKDYFTARMQFIESQFKSDGISYDEYQALKYNDSLDYHGEATWKLREDGRISSTTSSRISNWETHSDMLFRDPIDKYKSKQWEELKKIAKTTSNNIEDWDESDPRIEFYKLIVKIGEESDSKIIGSRRLGTRLPGILAKSLERIKQGQSPTELLKNNLTELFTINKEEEDLKNSRILVDAEQKEHRFVPVRFTTNLEPEDRSYDIATLYLAYASSANKYANTMKILPELEMTRDFIEKRKVALKEGGKFKYIDRIGGVYSKIKDARALKSEKENRVAEQFSDWLNMVVYEEGMVKTWVDKTIDGLSKYTAFRVLSVNIMNGVTNVLTGETTQKIEALSRQHTTAQSLTKASFLYDREIAATLNDVGTRAPKGLINLLTEEFRVFNDDGMTEYRKGTKAQQLFNQSKLFFLMHAGEHWMQSRFFMAMLDGVKAKDSNGNPIMVNNFKGKEVEASMLDMYSVKDGKLVLDSRVDEKRSRWSKVEKEKFSVKFKGLSRQMHGAYSEEERRAVDKYALGRALVQFRKFVMPGIERRWYGKQYNTSLQEYTEGNYRTWSRWIKGLSTELFAYYIGLKDKESGIRTKNKNTKFKKLLFEGTPMRTDSWEDLGFNHYEIANIKKTNMEIGAIVATIILVSFLIPMLEGDDDDKNRLKEENAFLYAMLQYMKFVGLRFGSEQMFYWNPAEMIKLMNSPIASYATIGDSVKLLTQLFDPTEVYERGIFKGDNKLFHKLMDLLPIIRQFYKLQDITSQSSWLKQRSLINYFAKQNDEDAEARQQKAKEYGEKKDNE